MPSIEHVAGLKISWLFAQARDLTMICNWPLCGPWCKAKISFLTQSTWAFHPIKHQTLWNVTWILHLIYIPVVAGIKDQILWYIQWDRKTKKGKIKFWDFTCLKSRIYQQYKYSTHIQDAGAIHTQEFYSYFYSEQTELFKSSIKIFPGNLSYSLDEF